MISIDAFRALWWSSHVIGQDSGVVKDLNAMGEFMSRLGGTMGRKGFRASHFVITVIASCWIYFAACQEHLTGDTMNDAAEASDTASASRANQTDDHGNEPARQILFGDLHVHSTYSLDAMLMSTPILGGQGLTGPDLHCEFARFCSQLDFWAITDHPESMAPGLWNDSKEAIRLCNDLEGGHDADPSMVSFVGWEWTQSAESPAADWGHKNVIFRDTADDLLPLRTIGAPPAPADAGVELLGAAVSLAIQTDPDNEALYAQIGQALADGADAPLCAEDTDTRSLPADCREEAKDPQTLYEKLDQWGFDALVIPHGTTWGVHNPALASWRYQLSRNQHRPDYERLTEIYSGHGNAEAFRDWTHVEVRDDGSLACPAASETFEPCCHRAGEITRQTETLCQEDPTAEVCEDLVAMARQAYVDAGLDGPSSIDNTEFDDWLDCGQCRDCFQPPFNHRPLFSVQAGLAMTDFEEADTPFRFRWGFVGSTDSHLAGPGAGYNEMREMADLVGPGERSFSELFNVGVQFIYREWERQNAYFYAGGLVAVHADGRGRDDIWSGLQRREVYATSGDRILLWFDLLGEENEPVLPMGSEATRDTNPTFQVRAQGAFVQAEGCPEDVKNAAPDDFIEKACFGQCYHPTDERIPIARIEVIKITPQIEDGEALDGLIQDPFVSHECPPDPEGCSWSFSDDAYGEESRPALYYVRVHQAASPQLNGDNLRCERDDEGVCIAISPCPGGYLGSDDTCLADALEKAWSSPIFLTPEGP
jgi:hypothetical protein